jgi:hypothetical protein
VTDLKHNANRDPGLIGGAELIGSVLEVGDGRGFVVRAKGTRYVITAVHCLPSLPTPRLALEEETYQRLIGPLGADQSLTAACVFADPVADLAVLGPPDSQALGDEHDRYTALLSTLPPFDIAAPPPRSRLRIPGEPPVFFPDKISFPARVLSLDGAWVDCVTHYLGAPLVIENDGLLVPGMSGSPLIGRSGAAVGVVRTSYFAACLWDSLPGWLLRALA